MNLSFLYYYYQDAMLHGANRGRSLAEARQTTAFLFMFIVGIGQF